MKSTYPISKAQSNLPRLVRESADGGAVAITRHDETVAYLVSRDRMEAIVETMQILGNPTALRAIHDYEKGRTTFLPIEALDDES
jgi:prevent-host-death family protein